MANARALLIGAGARVCFFAADVAAIGRHDDVRAAWWGLRRAAAVRPPHRASFEAVRSARAAGLAAAALTFGDTPVSLAVSLLRAAGVGHTDVVIDPLAGRGYVLLAARVLGAQARGTELDSGHVRVAAPILARAGATLAQGDARDAALSDATCVFLAWTCIDELGRARIAERLAELVAGARVVALTWEPPAQEFDIVMRARRMFPWGRVDVVHVRRR